MPDAAETTDQLRSARCEPCEGGVPTLSRDEATAQLAALDGWTLSDDATQIARTWNAGDFATGMRLLDRVAAIAEAEDHHPDVHLTGYRHVRIELTTHAIGGLSRNDFIVAAKIDAAADEIVPSK